MSLATRDRNMNKTRLSVAALLLFAASAASAQTAATGFTVHRDAMVKAPPARVYEALLGVAQWWNPAHTYTGSASNLSLDARPGGCFCERFPDGGGIEHLRVVYVSPGKVLRLLGGLGPLQSEGVSGSLTFQLSASPEGTKLEMNYIIGGYMDGGFERIKPIVDAVMGEQFTRLQSFAETGKPTR